MKKHSSILVLGMFLFSLASGFALTGQIDPTGTWIGEVEISESPEPDTVTFILKKEEGEYRATLTSQFGLYENAECEDIEFKNSTLTFPFGFFNGYSNLTIYVTVEVEGDSMVGKWESNEGESGSVKMRKEK